MLEFVYKGSLIDCSPVSHAYIYDCVRGCSCIFKRSSEGTCAISATFSARPDRMAAADFHGGDLTVEYSENDNKRQDDVFGLQLFFMKFMGQVPMELEEKFHSSWQKFGRRLALSYCGFCVLSNLHLAILYVKTTFDMLQSGELEEITDSLTMAIIFSFSTFATCYWLLRSKSLTAFLGDINAKYRHHSIAGLSFVSARRSVQLAHKITLYWLISCMVGVVCWGLAPLLMRSHTLPLKCWYPFDPLVCILI